VAQIAVAARPSRTPETLPPDVPPRLDLKGALTYALDNNFAIRQARERLREQEGVIVEVRARALPNATIDSSYTKSDDELNADRGFGGPISDQNWQVALTVRQTLFSGGGVSAALDAQRAVREAALLELQAAVADALLDVRTRFYDVLLAREQTRVNNCRSRATASKPEPRRNSRFCARRLRWPMRSQR
jgi:outer membrane protein TolC